MDIFVLLLILIVMMNRYVLGGLLLRLRGARADRRARGYEPAVAIVIPLFNEGEGIYHTAISLLEQDYPPEKLEIIIVDDCSTDDSVAWAQRAAEGRPNVTVLRNTTNLGKRRGINRGVRHTRAEIIVSVDSDVLVDRRAVRELVSRFASRDIAAVGGRTFVANHDQTWLTRMLEIKFYFAQEWLKQLEQACRSVLCLSGCLSAYRREVLIELEPILESRSILGVPIRYGEDRFLTRQILKAGYRTVFTTHAFCSTAAPPTLSRYFSQQLRWRRSNLVDFLCGVSHAWKLHPLIALHYLSLLALMAAYPLSLVQGMVDGELYAVVTDHLALIGLFGVLYWLDNRSLPKDRRVPAFCFLPIALLMPVSYLLLTPLALFTLDSGSWETRSQAKAA